MKTMKKAIDKFNADHNPYNTAILNELESYKGCYRVIICDDWGCASYYTFSSVHEFVVWSQGVVFENEF